MSGITRLMTANTPIKTEGICRRILEMPEVEKVCRSEYTVDGAKICVLVVSKYYLRTSNCINAVIHLMEKDDKKTACIAVTGGNEGIVNVSLGANRSFAQDIIKVLEDCGFVQAEFDLTDCADGFLQRFFQ